MNSAFNLACADGGTVNEYVCVCMYVCVCVCMYVCNSAFNLACADGGTVNEYVCVCVCVCVCMYVCIYVCMYVFLNNKKLQEEDTINYLGITVDRRFTFNEHIENITGKCIKIIHTCQSQPKLTGD